jgi:hypothetical protein
VLRPAYHALLAAIEPMLASSPVKEWFESVAAMPAFDQLAATIAKPVFCYVPSEDAQTDPQWTREMIGRAAFRGSTTLRELAGLGHCFAPMDGSIGELKTSGPLSTELLDLLAGDIAHSIPRR